MDQKFPKLLKKNETIIFKFFQDFYQENNKKSDEDLNSITFDHFRGFI